MEYDKKFAEAAREIISEVKRRKTVDKNSFNSIKTRIAKKYGIVGIPTNIDIAHQATDAERMRLRSVLSIKPIRDLSGVCVIAVMSKPHKCPHGKCIYCAGGVGSSFGDVPQSYTGKEPATRRAIRNDYDPYLQVMNRLEQYIAMNKLPDKADLIVMGGTFPSLPRKYQTEYVMFMFKALNDFSSMFFDAKGNMMLSRFQEYFELPGDLDDEERGKRIRKKLLLAKNLDVSGLTQEHARNEKSKIKCVGLTVETRPDHGLLSHGNFMLTLGCTKVEIGVQTTRDDILKMIERGHDIKTTVRSLRELKDLGFKLNFHMMPGLPGMNRKEMVEDFKQLFQDENYQPDMLKIYPCMVIKGTKLFDMYKRKEYKPLTTRQAMSLIMEFKRHVPHHCRIMRVQRDIPTYVTEAGVDRTNLRQMIEIEMRRRGIVCNCIRCNEVGRKRLLKKACMHGTTYLSSGGNEFFLYYGDDNAIVGFLRLRFPSSMLRSEITPDSAIVRELHVYGSAVEIGKKGSLGGQHSGIGKMLMQEAEEICRTYYKRKLLVISAVGTRGYYKKLGYRLDGVYMSKRIR